MTKPLQAVRGMNDITPAETPAWQYLEAALRATAGQYGYQEIRFPIVESTDLFKRSVGEDSDIVEKEMYTFEDRNGDMLTLRPEGTAPCVRAGIQQGLLYNQIKRLWYMGEMFRHERPQKGRYRQFYQFGIEAFGMAGPVLDVEIILFSNQLWSKLNLADHLTLQLNSLGSLEARKTYQEALVKYFKPLENKLDEDCKRRLTTNPMRILDSKNPQMQKLVQDAPKLKDFLDETSQQNFARVCQLLDATGVKYVLNPNLVRGLDYYSDTVFEWVTDKLGAQATVCAGGRYDTLVEQLGGKATPAAGFAMGLERILLLLETLGLLPKDLAQQPDVYLIAVGEAAEQQALVLAEAWRAALPALKLTMNAGQGSFKSQFKRADKSNAEIAVIIGEEELQQGKLTVKYLRSDKPQEAVNLKDAEAFLKKCYKHF